MHANFTNRNLRVAPHVSGGRKRKKGGLTKPGEPSPQLGAAPLPISSAGRKREKRGGKTALPSGVRAQLKKQRRIEECFVRWVPGGRRIVFLGSLSVGWEFWGPKETGTRFRIPHYLSIINRYSRGAPFEAELHLPASPGGSQPSSRLFWRLYVVPPREGHEHGVLGEGGGWDSGSLRSGGWGSRVLRKTRQESFGGRAEMNCAVSRPPPPSLNFLDSPFPLESG